MINRLTSRATGIQADVEAVGRKAIRQIVTDLRHEPPHVSLLLTAKRKEIRDVSLGHHQRMPSTERERIRDRHRCPCTMAGVR
jgi:hypothetical protein